MVWQFEVLDNMSKRVSIAIYQEGYLSKRKNGYLLKNIDPNESENRRYSMVSDSCS